MVPLILVVVTLKFNKYSMDMNRQIFPHSLISVSIQQMRVMTINNLSLSLKWSEDLPKMICLSSPIQILNLKF